jgi:CheY-like chemotaxis protein
VNVQVQPAPTLTRGPDLVEAEVGRAHQSGRLLTVALLEIEGLRLPVNPVLRAQVEEVVDDLIDLLCRRGRRAGHVVRWSWNQVLWLLPGTDLRDANREVNTLSVEFARRTLLCFNSGLAAVEASDSARDLLNRAAHALLLVKTAVTERRPLRVMDALGTGRKTVLLVEDDSAVSEMYSLCLSRAGYAAVIAGDGEEALRRIAELEPDLVVLDLQLPLLDGEQVLRRMRADRRFVRTPVVMLTNWGDDRDLAQRVHALGAIDCIVKSHLTPAEMIERIPRWLAAQSERRTEAR